MARLCELRQLLLAQVLAVGLAAYTQLLLQGPSPGLQLLIHEDAS